MKIPEHWTLHENTLVREFVFKDFSEAVRFVESIVPIANELDHHPDIEIFSYNHVRVTTTTHVEGNKVTEKDIALAKDIDILNTR